MLSYVYQANCNFACVLRRVSPYWLTRRPTLKSKIASDSRVRIQRARNPLLDPGVITERQSIALTSAERTGTGNLLMINVLLLWKSLDWATLELAAALEEHIKTAELG